MADWVVGMETLGESPTLDQMLGAARRMPSSSYVGVAGGGGEPLSLQLAVRAPDILSATAASVGLVRDVSAAIGLHVDAVVQIGVQLLR